MTSINPYKFFDKNHFESVFREHFSELCHFAYGFLNDRDTSQEIVQEVFIGLWQKRETIDPKKSLRSYLYTSVKNRSLNYIRDNRKFRSLTLDVDMELEIPVEDKDMITAGEIQTRIQEALDKLPPKCREVFEKSRFEEKKYKEIAEEMGISVKTVEVQMSKALKILRGELGDLIIWIMIFLTFR